MASLVEENLTSLDKEDMFIVETTKLARLFFEMQHKRKVTAQDIPKGIGPSRPMPEDTTPAVTDEDPQRLAAAAEYVGRRLREIGSSHEDSLTRAFSRYVTGVTNTIFDINYDIFQQTMTQIMSDVISTQQDQFNQIILSFAGALHISEALHEVGNDTHRQEEFARYVARFIVDQGLMPLVEQLGGWERIGQTIAHGTPV